MGAPCAAGWGAVRPEVGFTSASHPRSFYAMGSSGFPSHPPLMVSGHRVELRPRHESIVQTDTQSKPVEIQSQNARRGGAITAQTKRSAQGHFSNTETYRLTR